MKSGDAYLLAYDEVGVDYVDYMVIHDVQANSALISEEARVWIRGAAKGKGKSSYVDQPAQWEDTIARASIGAERVFQIQVIVAPPNAYEPKFNAAQILSKRNGVYCTEDFFGVASGAKNVLSAMNPARARIRVMCPSSLSQAESDRIRKASVDELGS